MTTKSTTTQGSGRRSSLAGSHPAAGAQNKQNGQNGTPQGKKRTSRNDKTTLTVAPDVLDEAKDGYWVAMTKGRHRTFAEYVTAALEAYNDAMREEYTKGKPFPKRPPGNLPTTHLS